MHCKNCGNQINPDSIVCLNCGCDPKKGNKHCNSCGVETNPDQIICIKCGVSLQNKLSSEDEGKTVAIVAYLTLIGFIIALVKHNDNKTKLGAYHLRQVMGFFITSLCFVPIIYILLIPLFVMDFRHVVGYGVFIGIISSLYGITMFVCVIISLINAVNGLEKPAPIFGKLYERLFTDMFDENAVSFTKKIEENRVWNVCRTWIISVKDRLQ